jgi:hypothetical protein
MTDTTTPQTDTHTSTPQWSGEVRTMTPQEFADLRAMIAKVQDNTLQPVLREIINLIGRAHGLDPAEEDKRVADEVKKRADDQAKLDKEQNDRDNAAADAKMAQAKRDMFVAMFGDSTSAPTASDTPPVDPNVTKDGKPLSQDQKTAMPDASAKTVTPPAANTPKATPNTPKDAA